MNHVTLLFGHADTERTFNGDLAESYERGARAAGCSFERIDLASLSFDPVLRAGFRRPQPLEPDLLRVKRAIEEADHLAWVFPMYWASPPAIVRAVVDRVFLPGWAFRYEKGRAVPRGLLAGRSARVITTMDSPSIWYTAVNHRTLHRSFGSATLAFSGLGPVRFTAVHGVRGLDAAARAAWCDRAERTARSDAESVRRRAPRVLPA